jgi:hypothetical protein
MDRKHRVNDTTGSRFEVPNLGVSCPRNSVPPGIAASDRDLAEALLARLMVDIEAVRALQPPYEPSDRSAIKWLIDMAPRLMSCCEALVANVSMYFDLRDGKKRDDWRQVMERRNSAIVAIFAYADFPDVLEHFATDRRLLGLRKSFKTMPAVSGLLAGEDPKDWRMSMAVAEALIRADWQTRARSPYKVLRRAAQNIQIDRVREMTREGRSAKQGGTKSRPGILRSLEQLQSAAAKLQQQWKEGLARDPDWDFLECESLADTPGEALLEPRFTRESISALRAEIQADPDMGAYVKAKLELQAPSAVRESLGWGPARIKRTRARLRSTAGRVLIRAID